MTDTRGRNSQFNRARGNTFRNPISNNVTGNQTNITNNHFHTSHATASESRSPCTPGKTMGSSTGISFSQQSTSAEPATEKSRTVELPQPSLTGISSGDSASGELRNLRFNVAVKSVWYHCPPGETHPKCAILIETNLLFEEKEVFASAKVPFVARSDQVDMNASTQNAVTVEISGHFPSCDEYFKVEGHDTPVISVPTPCISLLQYQSKYKDENKCITWHYNNPNGVFYPHTVRLLLVVKNYNNLYNPDLGPKFPFHLILTGELVVNLHKNFWGTILGPLTQLIGRSDRHEGWYFDIHEDYQPKSVMKALLEAHKIEEEKNSQPTLYGLHHAVESWAAAVTPGKSTR